MDSCEAGMLPALRELSHYRFVRTLDRGGMSHVYLAENSQMGNRAEVLHVLLEADLGGNSFTKRIDKAVMAAAKLNHPNIVTMYSAIRADRAIVLASEYVEGQNLEEVVKGCGPLNWAVACAITKQIALALEYANQKGALHGALKPSKLKLATNAKRTSVKLLGFGVARAHRELVNSSLSDSQKWANENLYLAPEIIRSHASDDVRSEIYSLGCTFFFLLTGQTPLLGSACEPTQGRSAPMPGSSLLTSRNIPSGIAELVTQMVESNPEKRLASLQGVADRLSVSQYNRKTLHTGVRSTSLSNEGPAASPENCDEAYEEGLPSTTSPGRPLVFRALEFLNRRGFPKTALFLFFVGVLLIASRFFATAPAGPRQERTARTFRLESEMQPVPLPSAKVDETTPIEQPALAIQSSRPAEVPNFHGETRGSTEEDVAYVSLANTEFGDQESMVELEYFTVDSSKHEWVIEIEKQSDGSQSKTFVFDGLTTLLVARQWREGPERVGTGTAGDLPPPEIDINGIRLLYVQKGSFTMGSAPTQEGHEKDEFQHEVELTRSFYLSQCEITYAQYAAFIQSDREGKLKMPAKASPLSGDDVPVVRVSWDDAMGFVHWLSKEHPAYEFGLPTEAEWEYACRCGNRECHEYWFGNDNTELYRHENIVGTADDDLFKDIAPVGKLKSNPWRFYDMHGNVSEWCHDWYESGYYSKSPERDPQGPEDGVFKVVRGGNYDSRPSASRTSSRGYVRPKQRSKAIGFRVRAYLNTDQAAASQRTPAREAGEN